MKWYKVAQVAEELDISKAAVYKKIKSLQEKLTPFLKQENGKTYISAEGLELLQQSVRSKEGTLWDDLAAESQDESTFNQPSTESLQFNETFNRMVEDMKGELKQKNQTIDKLLAQMEEDRKRQAEERQRTDTIIMKLAHDLEATRKSALAIEAKVDALAKKPENDKIAEALSKTVPEVKAWEPAPKKKPQYSFLQKFWYELIDPVKLRAI